MSCMAAAVRGCWRGRSAGGRVGHCGGAGLARHGLPVGLVEGTSMPCAVADGRRAVSRYCIYAKTGQATWPVLLLSLICCALPLHTFPARLQDIPLQALTCCRCRCAYLLSLLLTRFDRNNVTLGVVVVVIASLCSRYRHIITPCLLFLLFYHICKNTTTCQTAQTLRRAFVKNRENTFTCLTSNTRTCYAVVTTNDTTTCRKTPGR